VSAQWSSYRDARAAAQAASRHILELLEKILGDQDRATLAVSGGTTPKLLFENLAQARISWKRVHLFFVDERAVGADDPQSNYKLAHDFLIQPAGIPEINVHRVRGELAPDRAAELYSADIRSFFNLANGEMPAFDIVQQGMGDEGHTASLFPGEPLLTDRQTIAAAVKTPKPPPWRVTLTPGQLLAARHTVFLVSGADKAPAVRAVFKDEYDPNRLPAQLVSHQAPSVTWFLDDAASALLRKSE
jgi:6-phosphogluconolactonase